MAFLLGLSAALVELPNSCRLFVNSPFATAQMTVAPNGSAVLTLSIPPNPSLAGVRLHAQAIATDPALGVSTSSTLWFQLGQ